MTLSRGAIGNLVNRYRAVLRKCRMMNVFGSLAVAGMLVAGNAGFVGAEDAIVAQNVSIEKQYDSNTNLLNANQPQFSKELYAIGATGSQGKLDISMGGDAVLTVDSSWQRDAGDSNPDQLSAVYAGNGAQLSFTGTGLFKATGQGKVMEAVAFRNGANGSNGGTMLLTGSITGEAITDKASESGAGYRAVAVKAENPGTIIFSGKGAWLKAIAHAGTAQGVWVRYGGAVDFQSEEVSILSQSDTASAAAGISVEYSGGTIKSSEKTALTVDVKAPASTATGITLSQASKGLVDLAGSLVVNVEGTPGIGIENDQGTLKVAKDSSITGTGTGSFFSYGIWGRNGSTTDLKGDVDIKMSSGATVYGVRAEGSNVSLGSEGNVHILVEGNQGIGVDVREGQRSGVSAKGIVALGSPGKDVSVITQNIGIQAGSLSEISLNGNAKIESGTGISLSSSSANQFPSLISHGSASIIASGTGIVTKYAHAVFDELHIQAGTGIDVQSPGYLFTSDNTDTVLDVNGTAEISAQNTALQIAGAFGNKSANSGFVGTFNGNTSLKAINGNGIQLSGSTHSSTTAAGDCSVTFKGQTSIASERGTGVVVNGPVASTAEDHTSVVFEGATTIDAAKAIEIKKNNGKGASVTFAYNPTPINVPAKAQNADSQVNGSVAGTGSLVKSGGGSLALNGDNSSFSGEFNMQGGTAFLGAGKGYFSNATVNLTGGTLVAPEVGFSGGKLLIAGGTLETGTGQIFTSGLNAEGDAKDPGAVKLSSSNWKFDSGLIAFNDAKYNLPYAQTAASLLGADLADSASAKEVTFTGTYVNIPVPDPVSPYTYVGNGSNAISDETAGAWVDSTGASIPLSRIIQKTSEGGHSVYTLASGVYDGGSRVGSRFLQGDGTVHEIRSDGNLVLQNWFFDDVNGTGGVINTGGSVLFGDNVSILNNQGTGQGGAIHASKGVTFGAHALISGNKKTGMFAPGGGAIASEGNVVFGDDAELSNNEAGSSAYGGYGGALFVDGGNIAIGDRAVIHGNVSDTYGGALYAQKQGNDTNTYSVTIGSDAVIEQNTAGELGGGIFSYHPVTIGERATLSENRADNGGAIWSCSDIVLGSGTVAQLNTATRGGAIYSSGVNPDDESVTGGKLIAANTVFEKNNAEEKGGALYIDHGAVELKVTEQSDPVVMTGNTAGESGGFMYLDSSTASFAVSSGGTMRIGDAGTDGAENHLDTIGGDADSRLIKQGAGSLVIESSMSDFLGSLSIEEGTLQFAAPWAIQNTVTLNEGGTLKLPEFSFVPTGVGKLVLAGGTLNTGTEQIFTSGLNVAGDTKDPGTVKLSTNNWSFDSGLIAFDDAKYNLLYAQTAASLLGATNVGAGDLAGSASAKEITFTGMYVELPPVDPNSFETLQKAVLDTGIDSIKLGSDIVLSKRLQGNTAITRSLDINGNGHTISGPHPGLWFKGMDSGTVSIQNITFDGLKTGSGDRYDYPPHSGPAIFFDMGYAKDNWNSAAKLIIGDGVQFRNMEAESSVAAGGAVRTAHGIVEIGNNVSFINNSGGTGGGLYSESFTTIGDNVTFEGNEGLRGGGLAVVDDYGDYLKDPDYTSGARRVKYVHIGKNALFKDNSVVLLGSGGNGGAIEVQSGELSIDDGAVFTGNTSKSTGGAISVCDWSPQLPAKATLGSATFLKNSAGDYGGAVINEGDVRFTGPVSFVENTAGKIGGAICNLNTLNMAAESTFSKNTAGVGGGLYNEGIASLAKASFAENTATDNGGAVFNVNQLTFADGAVFSGNSATDGGAVYNDFSADKDGNIVSSGNIAFNGGARFTGNKASGLGGAIYNTRAVTLSPGAGQEIVFSGNTDSTGSNAIFMADGSSLNITGEGKVVFGDALSSENAASAVKKTGGGTLLLNASMDDFLGTASFEGGFTDIAQKWLLKNTVTVTGGKLKMPEFSFAAQDAENGITGGKLILSGGILETGTGQIFTNGLNTEGDTRNPGSVKLSANNWSFDSGLIAFDDAKYNLFYAQTAASLLGANLSDSASAKEITFTGTYVDAPVPDPVSPYYYVGNRSDAASDDTMGLWLDSTGESMTIKDVITVKKEPGQASEYHFLSGIFDGSRASSTTSVYACLIHGDDSGVRITSDGPLTIQGWGNGAWPYHAIILSNGQITFGDNVSLINNSSNGDQTKGGGAVFSKTGVTFGDNAVLSGNSTALAIGGGGYGGGAIFLDGSGAVTFGKNALIEKSQSYNYGGAIYSKGSVSMGEGATIRGNKTSYMGGALAVNGALSLGNGSLVEGNEAQAGGAVYSTGSVNATGTTFKKNVATTNYGGGIYSSVGSVVLADSRMEGNQAVGGGAIYLGGGATADVMGTAFASNTATNGGAFFVNTSGVLTTAAGVTGTSFTKNSVTGSGGAVYAQNSTVKLGSGTKLEDNQAAKGGALYLLGGSDNSAGLVLTDTTLTGNIATTYGGAVYSSSSGTVDVTANGSIFKNNSAKSGGALYLGGSGISNVSLTDTTFTGNHADSGNGGAVYSAISAGSNLAIVNASFENNSANYGGALFNNSGVTATGDIVFSGNTATYGGAIYNYFTSSTSGSLAFNSGARFTGNKASGLGGAIYNTRAITLNPGAGQEIVFSGNTDSTGSNAIFMADGSSLNVTGEGKVVFDDVLSSENEASSVKKTGGGTLLLNASMDGFLGTASFEEGRTEIAQNWLIKNTVTVTGGRLKMPEFSFVAQGEGGSVAGGKLILAGGILETGTGQIFTNGLNAEGDNTDPGAVKLGDDHWSFDSGLIAFNDANYNLTYAQAAADSLGASNVEAGGGSGSTSAKEITFIGTGYVDPTPPPVDPDPDPIPPVDPDPDPTPPVAPDPVPPAPEPEPDNNQGGSVSVDDLNANHANNIVLGNVTITTGTGSDSGKNFVVGTSVADSTIDSIAGSIGGKNVDLGSGGRDIAVVGGHYLTLVGGSSDTPLVTAGGNPVNVHVGDTERNTTGVLNLGTSVMDSGGNLSGNIKIAAASTVNVRAGTHIITGEANETTGTTDVAGVNNNGGTINIAEGAHLQSTIRQTDGQTNVAGKLTSTSVELSGGDMNVSGTVASSSVDASKGTIKVTGSLATDTLLSSSDVQINVGDQGSAGRVVGRQTQLRGGSVFLDPAWKGNDTLAEASHGVFTFADNEIDGMLTAGQNSLLVLGDVDTDWALDAFDRSGLQWGQNDVTAALAIRKPQTLNSALGAVMVDGSKTSAPALTSNTATFANGSLLFVDGSGLDGTAALTAQGGTLNVDAGAKLLMDNITQGEYAITSGFSVNNVQGWTGDNLYTPDNLLGLVLGKAEDGSMKVQATARRSSDVFRGLSLVNTMDAIWGKGLNDTESDNMGIRFLSRAVNENYLSKADTVQTVDGAAQIAVAGGVQGMAVAAADAPIRALQDHASLSHMAVTREGAVRKDGLDLWINALYGAEHARNLGAGALDGGYNADFGGVVFGGDYAFGDFRVGMALNAGSGTARSRGDFNATKNDFDFWGVNLYGSWSRDQFNIVGDLGYSVNKNEVKQDLPPTMQLGQLQADVDTGVLTAGLRGEYRFETDWGDVTPHAGVRYYNLRTDGFASRINDHDVFRVGRDTQEIWTFPIGVSLSRDFETSSGWKVKPRADLSVVPAAGDLKARTKVRVPGVAASDTVKARMMDSVSFDGTIGLEVQKDNVSFGLDYGIRASEHKTDHGVNLSFTYKF